MTLFSTRLIRQKVGVPRYHLSVQLEEARHILLSKTDEGRKEDIFTIAAVIDALTN